MTLRWSLVALLMLVGTGCATSRVVRLDMGEGRPIVFTPLADVAPVDLDEDEFEEAVQTLARTAPRTSRPRDAALWLFGGGDPHARVRARLGLVSVEEPRRGRLLVPEASDGGTELERAYGRWCQRKKLSGDCLHLLDEGLTLDEDGKRALAFRLALDSVWDETAEALEEMTDREAMVTMLVTTGVVYFGLWLVPEPLLSKGIAATLTVALIAYLGWDTVWSLVQGWRVLAKEVEAATTFSMMDAGIPRRSKALLPPGGGAVRVALSRLVLRLKLQPAIPQWESPQDAPIIGSAPSAHPRDGFQWFRGLPGGAHQRAGP
jgi:hypothetical protein